MARNLGPAMLENLEARRASMTEGEYQARRIEIEGLIARGKAVEATPLERILRVAVFLLCLFLGVWVATPGTAGAVILGLAIIALGILTARTIGTRV